MWKEFERDVEPAVEEIRMLARDTSRFRRVEPAAQRITGEPENVSIETDVDLDNVGRTTESS